MSPSFRILSLLAATLVAGQAQDHAHISRQRVDLGPVESFVRSLEGQRGERTLAHQVKGERLGARVMDFATQGDVVSLSGKAEDSDDSDFYLKGSRQALKGYLIKYDARKAFEYATDRRGHLTVTEVPFEDAVPCLSEQWLRATTASAAATRAVHPTYSPMALRQARHIGPYNNEDVTKLESKPGSPYVFYLNTTAVMSGTEPLNGVTKENMFRCWQVVADQYSMYNMNITTNRAVYDAAKAANILRTGIINYINADGRSYAPVHSFGTTSAGTLYRNPSGGFDYGYGIGMTCAHEVGHQMGMLHDHGGSGGEYFEGIAAYQWGPIMGNYWMGANWAQSLWTWSKGEYNTASNFEDDLYIMNVEEAVPYMPDDNPSGKALVLDANGAINPSKNYGQIERTGDVDAFTFALASDGTLDLVVDPIEYFGMLDVEARVVNSAGQVVARNNLAVNRSAKFTGLALAAGSYKLEITGGAEGTPQNGFSNYSSLGWYAMQGTLKGGTVTTPLAISTQPQNQTKTAGQSVTFTVAATGGKTPYTYRWFRNGSAIQNASQASYTFTTALADNGATFMAKVTDSAGTVVSSNSATLTVNGSGGGELIKNGGFESGATNWTGTTGVVGNWSSYNEPAYEGVNSAYFGGQGKTATENLYQAITLPSTVSGASLTFYLHIDTAETQAKAYDTLKVQVLSSSGSVLGTLATYSNLNAGSGYTLKTFDLSAYKGQAVRISFVMNEDATLQTSFLVDKVSVVTR